MLLLQSGLQVCVCTEEAQFSDQAPQLSQLCLALRAAAGLMKMLLLRLHSLMPAAFLTRAVNPVRHAGRSCLPCPCHCWQTQLDQAHPRLHPPLPLLQGSLR